MFELLPLIAIVVAIAAFSNARATRSRLEREIVDLKLRLRKIEDLSGLAPAEAAHPVSAMPQDGTVSLDTPGPEAGPADEPREPAVAAMASSIEGGRIDAPDAEDVLADTANAPAKARESLESRLAARWSVWVGGIALAFAGIFAVRYSIEQGLLSPAVRLSLAAIFGVVLVAAGEWVRRRSTPLLQNRFQNALIPGILTAAGTLTLMGAVFVAHGIYQYFGAAPAFVLLCLVSLATLALSLVHGQALAGLGLVASFVTPLMVSSNNPSPWSLFGFLSIAWIGSAYAARIRQWRVAPAFANAGLSAWILAYMAGMDRFEVAPAVLPLLIMVAGLAFVWPGRWLPSAEGEEQTVHVPSGVSIAVDGKPAAVKVRRQPGQWEQLLLPKHLASTLTAALGVMLAAVTLVAPDAGSSGSALWGFIVLVAALSLLGAYRQYAIYPAIFSGLAAAGGIRIMGFGAAAPVSTSVSAYTAPTTVVFAALGLGLFFVLLGAAVAVCSRNKRSPFLAVWSVIAVLTPMVLSTLAYFLFGNLTFDLTFGLFGIAFSIVFLVGAERAFGPDFDGRYVFARDAFLAGLWAALLFAIVAMTSGAVTTVAAAVLGFVLLLAGRLRNWPVLPWAMVASAAFVAGRFAWQPTIVGVDHLSTVPVFNQLLIGYGVPSLLLVASAWILRNSEDGRVRSVMEALASVFTLLTVGILVRHAMNGGVLNDAVPTLGEQAIYTLLTVGASTTLMAIDLRRPSIVFRTGSMAVGYISMLSVLAAHYVGLNPYFTGELTGRIPFFNLLFLAYLLPGLAYGLGAWYARGRRPMHYVIALALTGATLLFAYVSLSVRRFFHGESIAEWKGFLQPELYTYSVVWLLLGIILLVVGYRFRAKTIRIASAVLVLLAVVKVFLVDMSNLEGLFRVLSFIGLGVALIGIGRFYQTILSGLAREASQSADNEPSRPGVANS